MYLGKAVAFCMLCIQGIISETFEIRLIPPTSEPGATNKGTVQLRNSPTAAWGTVCDDGWDIRDANVACKMLGFSSATAFHVSSFFGTAPEPYNSESFDCNGDEERLEDCSRPTFNTHDCNKNTNEDAGVTCFVGFTTPTTQPPTQSNCVAKTDMRIVGGPNSAVGRVEVFRSNAWGTVCDDGFDYQAAQVICKGLCYGASHAKPYFQTSIAPGTGAIMLDELRCAGTESTLNDCPANKTHNDCTHKEDAVVSCINYSEGAPEPPGPEVLCHGTDMEVAFDRNVHQSLQESHLSLLDQPADCTVTTTTNSTHIAMFISYAGCMVKDESNSSHIIYWTTVKHDIRTVGIITRTHVFFVPVRCAILRDANSSRPFNPIEQTAPPQINNGKFDVTMMLFTDDNFASQVVSNPYNITLGAWLNVAVVLRTQDAELRQVVPNCWATTQQSSTSTPRYPLITDKCSVDDTLTIIPLNTTMFGFRLQSFDFVGNYSTVYLHCEVYVCTTAEKGDQCDQTCQATNKRKRSISLGQGVQIEEVFRGPIVLLYKTQPDYPIFQKQQQNGDTKINSAEITSSLGLQHYHVSSASKLLSSGLLLIILGIILY